MSRLVSRILPGFPIIKIYEELTKTSLYIVQDYSLKGIFKGKKQTLLGNMYRRGSDLTCYMTGLILALPPFINKTRSSTSMASITVKFVCFTDKTHSKANFCKITNLTFDILFSIVRFKNGTQKRDQNVTKLRGAIRAFPYKSLH